MGLARVAMVCALLAVGAEARAQSADEEARALFEQGRQAYDAGEFEEAVTAFRRAYVLSRRSALLYNIGQSELRLEHHSLALEAFEGYLRQEEGDSARRAEVEEQVRQLRALGATSNPEPAGPRGGFDPIGRQLGTWIALGVSVAAGALAIGLYYDGAGIYDSLLAGCGSTLSGCSDDDLAASGLYERELATNILWGTAGAALAAAIVLWIVEGIYTEPAESAAFRLDVGPGGLRGSF